ncbi:MAG: hypothetical protein AB7S50_06375 [Bacteroidales bacterium]
MFVKVYNDFVNFLSFANNLRDLRKKINLRIDIPEMIVQFPGSHPKGFIKEFKKRRTTILESYLLLTKNLESLNYNERIKALRLLAEHIIYSRSLKMPLNTARVQLALMKEVIKNRDNKRIQLELMHDFSVSSFGHPRVIRRFLKKFDIIEVPETGEELKDLKMGWDFHVHDNTSYGRKTPIQLIIDAFIKGISELTVAYTNLDHEEAINEILEAGKILGIKVNIAIEFSSVINGFRFHFLYVLPGFSNKPKKFKKFLKQKSDDYKHFLKELDESDKKRIKNIELFIDNFNKNHLPQINEGYSSDSIYYLHPLSLHDDNSGLPKIYSARQLGELLYPKFRKVIENRALQITAIKLKADKKPELFTKEEIENINIRFTNIRNQFSDLDPEKIRLEYFASADIAIPATSVSSLDDIFDLAKKSEGNIKLVQPLQNGLEAAVNMILDNYRLITHTEIFNIHDTIETKESDFILFTQFVKLLNDGNKDSLLDFFSKNNINVNHSGLHKTLEYIKSNKLIPAIGSDATGRSTLAPGMGFVMENRLPAYQRNYFKKRHYNMPPEVSELMYQLAKVPKTQIKGKDKANIICLGKLDSSKKNLLGDEKNEKPILPMQAWEYFNPVMKNFIFILIGFIPAYYILGYEYALLWFAITGSRNMFVDVISGNGLNPTEWRYQDINWENVAQSLFWTGFSVPILGFVKTNFDLVWTGPHEGTLFEFVKFFFINISNGLYLASHNYIRGFDKATIRANLFRSIIAWPFATLFSPIGNALGVPSIVQAKFWSDFVASIIEGTAKYKNIIKLNYNIFKKLIPEFQSDDDETVKLATLDLIYFMQESTRAKTVLKKQLIQQSSLSVRLKNRIKGKKKKTELTESYHELKKHISQPEGYNELVNYIIEHYNREQSLYLLKLVSNHYYKLQIWLEKLKN